MNYLLGTGAFRDDHAAFAMRARWETCVLRTFASTPPEAIVTLAVGDAHPPEHYHLGQWLRLPGNLGHVGDLLNGSRPHKFCGWSAAVIQLAMTAYCAELDFMYLEEDCLAFGPWVQQTYADLGDGQFVFGRKMTSAPWMQCSQSLFLIRHAWIPTFVHAYLGMGKDGDPDNLPETKFARIEEMFPAECRRLSFGVDRERPLPYDAPVWFAQKLTPEEMTELVRRGLV